MDEGYNCNLLVIDNICYLLDSTNLKITQINLSKFRRKKTLEQVLIQIK